MRALHLTLLPLLFPLLLSRAVGAQQEPTRLVEVELSGPLTEVVWRRGPLPTRLACELGPGESRRCSLPFTTGLADALVDAPEEVALRLVPAAAGGAARVLGAAPGGSSSAPDPLLLRRSRPPVGSPRRGVGLARLLLVAGGGLLLLALLRRGANRRALSLGGACAGFVLLLPAPAPGPAGTRVLEGDAARGGWLEVRAARDELALSAGSAPVLAWRAGAGSTEPVLACELPAGGDPRCRLLAPTAVLYLLEQHSPPGRLDPAANEAYGLARAWTRTPGGAWSTHGAWPVGEALPPRGASGRSGLPGWLSAALPQGVGILVAEVEAPSPQEPRWVRLTGFAVPDVEGSAPGFGESR